MRGSSRDEALRRLDALATEGLAAFVNLAQGVAEHPGDRQVQSAFTRALVDLDRVLRLEEAVRRRR